MISGGGIITKEKQVKTKKTLCILQGVFSVLYQSLMTIIAATVNTIPTTVLSVIFSLKQIAAISVDITKPAPERSGYKIPAETVLAAKVLK